MLISNKEVAEAVLDGFGVPTGARQGAATMSLDAQENTPIARLRGITKSYPGVTALSSVDFDVQAGEVHCLVGENGAGKSTLMRVMTGATQPDAGEIAIDGRPVRLDPASAIRYGIGIVHQELDLVPALSVAENIFLGHAPTNRLGLVERRALRTRAADILSILKADIRPETEVRTLPPALQQLVQIAKALSHENRLLILDEPTAALSDNESERLFEVIRRLKQRNIGVVYISHRLEEVRALGDRLTVFRDGQRIVTRPVAGMSHQDIIKEMVGRPLTDIFPRSKRSPGDTLLSVRSFARRGEFEGISFDLRRGEVLALAGIVGAGRSELLETIFGLRKPSSGEIIVQGTNTAIRSPRHAIGRGMGLVPEERRESGLVLGRSVADNLGYPVLKTLGRWWKLDHGAIGKNAKTFIEKLRIKTPSPRSNVSDLSGGNQQKIVIGKWMAAGVNVLLLDEPTRGVDVNAKAEIYKLIDELARSGAAILMASSEMPEILGVSDRVLVMSAGRQAAILKTEETNQVEIMLHALGGDSTGYADARPEATA